MTSHYNIKEFNSLLPLGLLKGFSNTEKHNIIEDRLSIALQTINGKKIKATFANSLNLFPQEMQHFMAVYTDLKSSLMEQKR